MDNIIKILFWFGLFVLLLVSTGCGILGQTQPLRESPGVSTAAQQDAPSATMFPSSTSAPTAMVATLTAVPTEALTAEATQSGNTIEPFHTSAAIQDVSWSPDGDLLRFLSQSPEDIANSPAGEGWMPPNPGTVHYYNVRTGEGCSYEENNPEGLDFNRWFAWLPDYRISVLTYNGQLVALEAPCSSDTAATLAEFPERVQDVYATARDNSVLLLKGETSCWLFNLTKEAFHPIPRCSRDLSFSPQETYLGITNFQGTDYTTDIYRVENGELVRSIPWTFGEDGLGTLPGPIWLGENRFVIYRTDEGALLVTLGENFSVQPIVPTFFDMPGIAHQYIDVDWDPETETVHFLLTDFDPENDRFDIWLYHGESGDVEVLHYDHASFTKDGKSLWLTNSVIIEGYEQDENFIRPIDPPENKDVSAIHVDEIPFVQDAPDGDRFAQYERLKGADAFVYIFDLSTGEVLETWNMGNYEFSSFVWSPDSQHLVFIGTERLPREQATRTKLPENPNPPTTTIFSVKQALFILSW